MSRKPYPSDLTDAQWEELAPLLPPDTKGARPEPRTCVRWSTASCTCCAAAYPGVSCPTTCPVGHGVVVLPQVAG